MKGDAVTLRPFVITDSFFLKTLLDEETSSTSGGPHARVLSSWPSVWIWVKRTYALPYCIIHNASRIGFIGVYGLAQQGARISLIIQRSRRRKRLGTAAFNLVAQNLLSRGIREITANVEADNHAAFSFWKKLGFAEHGGWKDGKILSLVAQTGLSHHRQQ